MVWYRQGNYVEAADAFRGARDLAPRNLEVSRLLGKSLLFSHQYTEARQEYYRALSIHPAALDPQVGLARIATRLGDYDGATRLYRKVLLTNPSHAVSLHNLGSLRYRAADYEEARNLLTRLLAMYPEQVEAHYLLGMTLMKLGDVGGAEREFVRVIDLDPDHTETHFNLAKLYVRAGKAEAAQREQETFLRLSDPTTVDREVDGPARDRYFSGDFAGALKEYDKLIQGNPSSFRFHLGRALTLIKLERLEEAALSLEKAASLEATHAEIFYHLAAVYQQLGLDDKSEEARQAYETLEMAGARNF
jgi:Flp pilus assembly protein TadD